MPRFFALPVIAIALLFTVPLHAQPGAPFGETRDHLLGALDWIAAHPGSCEHFEMETYTWEVLPTALRLPIEDQLVREYAVHPTQVTQWRATIRDHLPELFEPGQPGTTD